jgi:hypothetical protein
LASSQNAKIVVVPLGKIGDPALHGDLINVFQQGPPLILAQAGFERGGQQGDDELSRIGQGVKLLRQMIGNLQGQLHGWSPG